MDREAAKLARLAAVLLAGASLAACATTGPQLSSRPPPAAGQGTYKVGAPYQVGGVWYVPREQPGYDEVGVASWYGDAFHMKSTANGEIFDKDVVSAAHTTLPLPSMVEVTNLDNGRKLVVRVNDRGPFVGNRIIDLSHAAARELGYDRQGLARVRVRYVGPAPLYGEDTRRYARYQPPPAARPAAVLAPPPPRSPAPDVVMTSGPLPKGPAPVIVSRLAPLPTPAPRPAVGSASGFRVQAGAFTTADNARRVADRLADAGPASVEPISRSGMTLYRVVLDGPADADEAEALRQKVAEAGLADARVIRPF